jgi:hypothetical protein
VRGGLGLLAGALCAIGIACAASQKPAAQAMPAAQEAAPSQADVAMPQTPRDQEIDRLAREIETQRVEAKLPLPEPSSCTGASCARIPAEAMSAGAQAPVHACRRDDSDTCKQSCTLADSICSNAKKICEIANELAGDDWAARKCADGSATCNAAKARCCDCSK